MASSYLPNYYNKTPLFNHALTYLGFNWMALASMASSYLS